MEPIRILFICSEIAPFIHNSEMAILGRDLPLAAQEKGRETRSFTPRFGNINERRNQLHEVIRLSGLNLVINDTDHPLIIKVASTPGGARAQVYFIDNDDFFRRKHALNDCHGRPFVDNDERTIFFVRGVLETVKKLRWRPSIVHCQGWFTYLTALLVKKMYKDDPLFARTKIVLAFPEDENFEGLLSMGMKEKLQQNGMRAKDIELLSEPTYDNLVKLAVTHSDGIIFFGKKNNIVNAFAKDMKKQILFCKKPLESYEECNEFYIQIMRTK